MVAGHGVSDSTTVSTAEGRTKKRSAPSRAQQTRRTKKRAELRVAAVDLPSATAATASNRDAIQAPHTAEAPRGAFVEQASSNAIDPGSGSVTIGDDVELVGMMSSGTGAGRADMSSTVDNAQPTNGDSRDGENIDAVDVIVSDSLGVPSDTQQGTVNTTQAPAPIDPEMSPSVDADVDQSVTTKAEDPSWSQHLEYQRSDRSPSLAPPSADVKSEIMMDDPEATAHSPLPEWRTSDMPGDLVSDGHEAPQGAQPPTVSSHDPVSGPMADSKRARSAEATFKNQEPRASGPLISVDRSTTPLHSPAGHTYRSLPRTDGPSSALPPTPAPDITPSRSSRPSCIDTAHTCPAARREARLKRHVDLLEMQLRAMSERWTMLASERRAAEAELEEMREERDRLREKEGERERLDEDGDGKIMTWEFWACGS